MLVVVTVSVEGSVIVVLQRFDVTDGGSASLRDGWRAVRWCRVRRAQRVRSSCRYEDVLRRCSNRVLTVLNGKTQELVLEALD